MFFEADDGTLYPVERIASILAPGGDVSRLTGGSVRLITLDDGTTVAAYAHAVTTLLRRPAKVFEALPETFILRVTEVAQPRYTKTPVIAWSLGLDGILYPITPDGVNDNTDDTHYVLTPDGTVTQGEIGSWLSIDTWLKDEEVHPFPFTGVANSG
ncbi:MAG: hypothetical protein J7515_19775 [Caulobacter sp.]|nr:hypothetical protein [Caulobacter sp.]